MSRKEPPHQHVGFSDPSFHSENELQLPLPTIQPDYTFLPDDAIHHTVPPIDGAFVDANPNVIHYDIFAGMHLNLVDPFKYIWNTKLLGHPIIDADDIALFPPEIVEELIKDPQHKAIIPSMDDITDARRRLLNMANFFDPLGDLDEDARLGKEQQEAQTKTLEIVKPHMFKDDYAKAKTMESAQQNAMNYYYQPIYTEDTIQTWVSKRKYQNFAEQQRNLEAFKTLGEKKSTKLLTVVDKTPGAIKLYIDESFDAMDQPPIHPIHGHSVQAVKVSPFFSQPLDQFVHRPHPQQLPPLDDELNAKLMANEPMYGANNNTLVWITATSEAKLTPQNIISTEHQDTDDGRVLLDAYSIFRPAVANDLEFLQLVHGMDEETSSLLTEASQQRQDVDNTSYNLSSIINVWESLAQPVPIQQLIYEDSFIARYDSSGNVIANNISSRVALKPFQLAAKAQGYAEQIRALIAEMPHVVTINHPAHFEKAFDVTPKVTKLKKVQTVIIKPNDGFDTNKMNDKDIDRAKYSNEGRRYGDDEEEDGEDEEGTDGEEIDLFAPKTLSKRDIKPDRSTTLTTKSSKKDKKDRKSDKRDKKSNKDKRERHIEPAVVEVAVLTDMGDGNQYQPHLHELEQSQPAPQQSQDQVDDGYQLPITINSQSQQQQQQQQQIDDAVIDKTHAMDMSPPLNLSTSMTTD